MAAAARTADSAVEAVSDRSAAAGISEVHTLLYNLGISINYKGFSQTSCALRLALQNPELLLSVTTKLYSAVASECGSSRAAVERNIRTIITAIWNENPNRLRMISNHPMRFKPTNAQFLALLTAYLAFGNGAGSEQK